MELKLSIKDSEAALKAAADMVRSIKAIDADTRAKLALAILSARDSLSDARYKLDEMRELIENAPDTQ